MPIAGKRDTIDPKPLYRRAKPLVDRIAAQQAFGTRDLASWLKDLIAPQPSERVLDIGCGNGHHLLTIASACRGGVGLDMSDELLQTARRTAAARHVTNVRFLRASGETCALGKERFDIAMCHFALYYMRVPPVLSRMTRYLLPSGRAFITGSPDENAQELLAIHRAATAFVPAVYAPGFSDIVKYRPLFEQSFASCVFHRFVNPLNFPSPEAFMGYYMATTLFQSSQGVCQDLEDKVFDASAEVFRREGVIRITKIVDAAELRRPVTHERAGGVRRQRARGNA